MKKVIQILAILLVILVPVILTAQPMPWDPGVGGGTGSTPVGGGAGGGAPIGGGLIILLSWLLVMEPAKSTTPGKKSWTKQYILNLCRFLWKVNKQNFV